MHYVATNLGLEIKMNRNMFAAAAVCAAILLPAAAQATEILPGDLQGWAPANVTASGNVAITGTYVPPAAGQTGSLELGTNGNAGKANFVYNFSNGLTLGDLVAGNDMSFQFYRDNASNAPAHLAPVVRFFFQNAQGKTGFLIWESVYNGGGAVAEGSWITADLTNANFYQRTTNYWFGNPSWPSGGTTEVPVYNKTLADFMTGAVFTAGGKSTYELGAGTLLTRVEIGVGSGWTGKFIGAADNLHLNMGSKGDMLADFEMVADAVPEPATWAMLIAGFGLVGAAARRRQIAGSRG